VNAPVYPRLASPLALPCGVSIPNRFAKGAMTEQMSDERNAPTEALLRLYERWGCGGCGVLITGNVMVDRRALEGPRNVAVEDARDLPLLRRWAESAQSHGSQLWMQISHPGRQTPRGVSAEVVAPSAVPVKGQVGLILAKPRALTEAEIHAIIARFATTAAIAKAAGFAGVQIHSAHGYLLSQFLSPRVNQREDAWGGTPEKRRRFPLEIARAVRAAVGPGYPLCVKLNSADFQRGGFDEAESMDVVQALEAEGIDLLEISGGSYEKPMMVSTTGPERQRESTRRREGFFLEYAEAVRAKTKMPLMLTGGMRTPRVMEQILEDGAVDVIGIARPLALDPDFCRKAIEGTIETAPAVDLHTGLRTLDDMLQSLWHQEQFKLMAAGEEPNLKLGKWGALARGLANIFGPK
jgi:2,4-dienoyl-CoA reductase-like NADH-dependent reductase (Old Yellow Enzyme family)